MEGTPWTDRQRAQFEDESFRNDFNVKTDEEVRDVIFDAISNLPKSIQVRTRYYSFTYYHKSSNI